MKTRISYLLAVLTAAISCVNEDVPTSISGKEEFFCHIENEETTRTTLDQNNNVMWSAEDQLVIFKKNSIPARYEVSENCVGKTSGSFYKVNSDEFNAGLELDHNIALYPYQDNIEITKLDSDSPTSSYKITGYNFSAEQTYMENSFANGAFPMAAVSDNYDLTFRNICGGIKLQLKGTQKVTSIKIEGKNSEKLAGNADITVYADETLKPAITMASDASASVILNCGDGVQLSESSATNFIISLPPVVFSNGLKVTVKDEENNAYTIETEKENVISRSMILIMPQIILGDTIDYPNDEEVSFEDYVDEYGVNHGVGIDIAGCIWAPVNCGYHELNYPYGKLYQWGRKYGQGYNSLYDIDSPQIVVGPISLENGQNDVYKNTLFSTPEYREYDWVSPQYDDLWNSGTEEDPIKSIYDPCPVGWRVPTSTELNNLIQNYSSWTVLNNQYGRYYSGDKLYAENVKKIFLPAAGRNSCDERGGAEAMYRDVSSDYWSSTSSENTTFGYGTACLFCSRSHSVSLGEMHRSLAATVRCVQE